MINYPHLQILIIGNKNIKYLTYIDWFLVVNIYIRMNYYLE